MSYREGMSGSKPGFRTSWSEDPRRNSLIFVCPPEGTTVNESTKEKIVRVVLTLGQVMRTSCEYSLLLFAR